MYDLQTIRWDSLQIGRELGKGNFATVYLGHWQGTDVAVKHLAVSHLPADLSADCQREAVIHAKCSASPRIARLFGITQEPGHFALVMEYMPKGALYDVLHDSSIVLPWPTRWEIAIDVGTGLAYLHGAKILHQDLKSLNVLLDHDLRAKITDFGQSKIKTHMTVVGKSTGTVRWCAPEIFKHGYTFSESADVYSYGMILWELASRALPFADQPNDMVVIGWIKDDEKETIPVDCPPVYAAAIQAAWRVAAARPSAEDFARDLTASKLAPFPAAAFAAAAPAAPAMAGLSLTPMQAQVNQLLLHVARGEQDAAEALCRTTPTLLFYKGQVTDYSNRIFHNITAFQYALWAYDWYMWEMLLRYLPAPAAKQQLYDLERNSTEYGKHYDTNELLQALKNYVDNISRLLAAKNWDEFAGLWNQGVGGAQCRVPAHVAHEYCRPDRPFYPTPSFTAPTLPRVLTFEDQSSGGGIGIAKVMANWFPLDGSMGSSFAVLRYSFSEGYGWSGSRGDAGSAEYRLQRCHDLSVLTALYKTRTTQYGALQQRLS